LGFYGVIDERIDFGLLATAADARPEWSIVMVGPLAKLREGELPQRPNIFYLGPKPYGELPDYLAGWDAGLMPFAINEATRFISPTKTPVVATPVRDVVRQYGNIQGVLVGDTPAAFIDACEQALQLKRGNSSWLTAVDAVLADASWDRIFAGMEGLVADVVARRRSAPGIAAA
jgi:UDP-galactopyranose mutase